jgi:hypothetical protein
MQPEPRSPRDSEDGARYAADDQTFELVPDPPPFLEVARDPRLTFTALGIMQDLLTEPRAVNAEALVALVAQSPAAESLEEVRDALLELESVGYIRRLEGGNHAA